MNEIKKHKTLCRMCNDHCGIVVHTQNNKVIEIEGNKDHIWNKGRICIKANGGVAIINSPQRITKPLKKVNGEFIEIPLDQALDEIAEKIKNIQSTYDTNAMSVWKGEALGFEQQEGLYRRFIYSLDSPNYFSNDSQCFSGRWIGYSLTYGRWNSSPDFINSQCIVIWGSNPPVAHPNMTQQINAGREKNAKLIVIDSRLTEIALQADKFIQINPGTDGALAWGIIRQLIDNDYLNHDFINNYTVGFNKIKEYSQKFTYEYVAKEIGYSIAETEDIMHYMADTLWQSAPKVVNYVGNGLEHHENGTNNIRAIAYIDGLLESVDAFGGNYSFQDTPLKQFIIEGQDSLLKKQPLGYKEYPVLYDYLHECHTLIAMDTILTEKPYPLKGMIIAGANPVLTNANTKKVTKALSKLNLLVVRELFMTETAKLADYILPSAMYLERSEVFTHNGFEVINLTKKVVEPAEDIQTEYEFILSLATRLGVKKFFPWANEDSLNNWILSGLNLSKDVLKEHKNGYKYTSRVERKHRLNREAGEKPFNTVSGLFEFSSKYLKALGYNEIAEYISPTYKRFPNKQYPFVLITGARKVPYSHSSYHNIKHLKPIMNEPEVELHPEDAYKLHIENGEYVSVTTKIGSMKLKAKIRSPQEIKKGALQISHGWNKHNVNHLTHDDILDPLDGFPLMKSIQARIDKI